MATVITNDSLIKDKALNTVKQYEDDIMSTGNSIINSSLSSIKANEELVNSAIETNTGDINKINTLNKDLLGKAQFTADQRKLAGVDTEISNLDKYGQELNTINANIKGLSREAQAIPLQLQEEFKNTGATDVGVTPIQTGRLRENAIKALTQASLADIAVANIKNAEIRYNTALDKANLAVDLKYKPIETEITQLKEQLALNKEFILDPAEKRLMAKQEKILNERTRLLEEKKQEEKEMNDLKVEVAKMGGNPASLDKAKSFKEAINIASSTLRNSANEIVKLDNGNTVLINKFTGQQIKNLGGAKSTTGTGLPYRITKDVLSTNNNSLVSLVSNIVKQTDFKKNETFERALNVISGVERITGANPEGKFEGLAPIRLPNRYTTTEGRTNRADIAGLDLKVQQWASGASLTAQQTEKVLKMVPKVTDTDKQVKDKLNSLTNYMAGEVRGGFAGSGVDVTFDNVDYFNSNVNNDPLGVIGGADPLGIIQSNNSSSLLDKILSNSKIFGITGF